MVQALRRGTSSAIAVTTVPPGARDAKGRLVCPRNSSHLHVAMLQEDTQAGVEKFVLKRCQVAVGSIARGTTRLQALIATEVKADEISSQLFLQAIALSPFASTKR